VTELDVADDEGLTPGGEIVSEELIVQVVPQGKDEFTCASASWSGTGPSSPSNATASPTASSAKADNLGTAPGIFLTPRTRVVARQERHPCRRAEEAPR